MPSDALHAVPTRFLSPVISSAPFRTDILATVADLETLQCKLPFLKSFLTHLKQHESMLFSASNISQRALEMQALLGLAFNLTLSGEAAVVPASASSQTSLTYAPANRLCSLLSAYHLLDVAAFVDGSFPTARTVLRGAVSDELPSLHKYSSLNDWPRLLLECRRSSRRSKAPPQTPEISTSAFSGLFRHLQQTYAAITRHKCEANIIVAATHLAVILGGSFVDGALPDIPDKLDALTSCIPTQSDSSPAVQDVATFLGGLCGTSSKAPGSENLSFLRSPLHLALAVSPLYLLVPIQLTKKSFHRAAVMAISALLGNDKPSLLADVERCIWRTLFGLALKTIDPSRAVDSILDLVPWEHVEALPDNDPTRLWFDVSRSNTPPTANSLQETPHRESSTCNKDTITSTANEGPSLPVPLPGMEYLGSPQPESPAPLPLNTEQLGPQKDASPPSDSSSTIAGAINAAYGASSSIGTDGDATSPNEPTSTRRITRSQTAPDAGLSDASTQLAAPPPLAKLKRKRASRAPKKTTTPDLVESEESSDDGDGELGASASNPIDVDLFSSEWDPVSKGEYDLQSEDVHLDTTVVPIRKESGFQFHAYDADGKRYEFNPAFHHQDYHSRLSQFFKSAEGFHEGGKPLHVAHPEQSVFEIVPYGTFASMSPSGVHRLLRSKNILVTGCPPSNIDFNEQGLSSLHPLHASASIQDYSFGPSGTKASAPKTVAGTVKQLLDSAKLGRLGKILNGLEFPRWDAAVRSSVYATESAAWHNTRKNHRCPLDSAYPVHHMNWGLAGTADTVTFVHIDSDGLGTTISVMCGMKVWGIYRSKDQHALSNIDSFQRSEFFLDKVQQESPYGFELVVLRPNDTLIMRPNTPHFVFGPENTICHGSHYYATTTLQDTACSLIHSFVLSDFITNITHHPTRLLLRRTLLFFYIGIFEGKLDPSGQDAQHMPNISNIDGLLDLLALCNLVILGNVLDFRTYSAPNQGESDDISPLQKHLMDTFDRNDIPSSERLSICYARGVASVILDIVRMHCKVLDGEGQVTKDLPTAYLVQQMRAILAYKSSAMRKGLSGAPHCSTALLRSQLRNIASWSPSLASTFEGIPAPPLSLAFAPPPGCKVVWTHYPPLLKEDHDYDFLALGLTGLDRQFFESERTKVNFGVADNSLRVRSPSRAPSKRLKRDPSP